VELPVYLVAQVGIEGGPALGILPPATMLFQVVTEG